MAYKFSFEEQFKLDLAQSQQWYNKQQKGLGKKFKQDVKFGLDAIRSTPNFAVRYNMVRCFPLKKFPFMIHYYVDEHNSEVIFLACIHCSLDPDASWIKKK